MIPTVSKIAPCTPASPAALNAAMFAAVILGVLAMSFGDALCLKASFPKTNLPTDSVPVFGTHGAANTKGVRLYLKGRKIEAIRGCGVPRLLISCPVSSRGGSKLITRVLCARRELTWRIVALI